MLHGIFDVMHHNGATGRVTRTAAELYGDAALISPRFARTHRSFRVRLKDQQLPGVTRPAGDKSAPALEEPATARYHGAAVCRYAMTPIAF